MADETEVQQDADSPAKGRSKLKPMLVVGALMLVEGVGIFALLKIVSPTPESALSAEIDSADDDPFNLNDQVEVKLCEVSAFNRKEGPLYVYNVAISALVAADDVEKVKRFVEVRELSIKDRVQVVFRSADPKDLNDPTLETIKRQLRFELNNLLGGKELINDVLIPKLLQSRTNL